MYPDYMRESIKKVEKTRPERFKKALKWRETGTPVYPRMSEEERNRILRKFHPDYQPESLREVRIGPNKGEKIVCEIADILESYPRIDPDRIDLSKIEIETDVLVIGGGGAGAAASLLAAENGAKVVLATKLRFGDANTMMAQGGIQASEKDYDSPVIHFLDTMGGGRWANKPELVKALVLDAPKVVQWLNDLGVMFDRDPDGRMHVETAGGTCRKRLHFAKDYTGGAIMRALKDEVLSHPDKITVIEFSPAVELIKDDEGKVCGAILYNFDTEEYFIVKSKVVVLATGGFGRLHIRGFATTNHYGATADGLVLAYRAGAKLRDMDAVQYHPTGAVFPEQIAGYLCTEKLRSFGAQPVNVDGELFVYPLEPRDVEASSYMRECLERKKGITTPAGRVGIWLDTPLIDMLYGKGTIEKSFPAMARQFRRYGIDISKEPILVYPTLHYQNGGVEINEWCETNITGLLCAGEVSGGVHGKNRLMGNSLLDCTAYGRRAGIKAAELAKKLKPGKLTLNHVKEYVKQLDELGDIPKERISPVLLPNYTPEHVKERQLTTHYHGTLR